MITSLSKVNEPGAKFSTPFQIIDCLLCVLTVAFIMLMNSSIKSPERKRWELLFT